MNGIRYKNRMLALLIAIVISLAAPASGAVTRPEPEGRLLASTYTGDQYLKYDISWMGVIKAGELVMEIKPLDLAQNRYLIKVTARSAGLLALFYPVKDRFEIVVQGRDRLPVRMIMDQHEGDRRNRKVTVYDQKDREVITTKDQQAPVTYVVKGPVHNEFSSFLIMRALPFQVGESLMVPTFADKKRHEVKILVEKGGVRQSVLGRVETMKVQPQLHFKGLYDKVGNPEIWLTADHKRVPVYIKAKVKIGSLAAELVEYRRRVTKLEVKGSQSQKNASTEQTDRQGKSI